MAWHAGCHTHSTPASAHAHGSRRHARRLRLTQATTRCNGADESESEGRRQVLQRKARRGGGGCTTRARHAHWITRAIARSCPSLLRVCVRVRELCVGLRGRERDRQRSHPRQHQHQPPQTANPH
eukprot:3310444-Rhodomonas_salina.1